MGVEKIENSKIEVYALVTKKEKRGLIKRIFSLSSYGRISFRFANSEKNHYFFDFIDVEKEKYNKIEMYNILTLPAYRGRNNNKLYLRQDEAMKN